MKPLHIKTSALMTLVYTIAMVWPVLSAQRAIAAVSRKIVGIELQTYDRSSFELARERTKQLVAMARYEDGHLEAYEGSVDWSVDNPSLAEILPDGRITGKMAGQVIVTVRIREDDLAGTQSVKVNDDPIRIYFKAPPTWKKAHLWVWYLRGRAHPSGLDELGQPLGTVSPEGFAAGWPGPQLQPLAGAPGWYWYDVPRYDSAYLKGQHLRKQPFRVIFNNPATQEKSTEFLRDGGCFEAEGTSAERLTGAWHTGASCPEPSPMRLVVEPAGGPFWGSSTQVRFFVVGDNSVKLNYAVDELPQTAGHFDFEQFHSLNGAVSMGEASRPQTITLGADLPSNGQVSLCLSAQNSAGRSISQCYSYRKMGSAPSASRPGADYHGEYTTFSVWSPERHDVRLWLDGRTISMGYLGSKMAGYSDLYSITVEGNYHLKPYHFLFDGETARDPYAVMVNPGTDFNIIASPAAIPADSGVSPVLPLVHREDAVIYETSVRDFTWHISSGVTPGSDRGTFRGMTRTGTRLADESGNSDSSIKTGLDHLRELGVTHVQLLPVFDYGTCSVKDPGNAPGCYNWGYDPENFNVPEERYSAYGPTQYELRIKEFKNMVGEFHKAGIRVVMDVVYNHSWTRSWREQDEGERYFSQITNKYFLHNSRGQMVDLTGTGNTIDVSNPMVSRYIRDSLEFWVSEYGIDGFRFDLVGSFDAHVVSEWGGYLSAKFPGRQLLLYGEPWVANPQMDIWGNHIRLKNIGQLQMDSQGRNAHFGAFNDIFRNAIKGESDSGRGAFVFNETTAIEPVCQGLRGSVLHEDGAMNVDASIFATDPEQSINYVSAHDNLTLWDKIELWSAGKSGVSLEYKKRIQRFAEGVVLTAQGIPFLLGGEEMARTKFGVKNSYESPDQINQIDWNRKRDFGDTFAYHRALIAMRRAHPSLRLTSRDQINARVNTSVCDGGRGLIVMTIKPDDQEGGEDTILLYNSGAPFDFSLPLGSWKVAMRDGKVSEISLEEVIQGSIRVDGTAITVLFRQR